VGIFVSARGYSVVIDHVRNTESLLMRFEKWDRTLQMVKENPFLGVGAGNWKINIAKYGNEYTAIKPGETIRSERFFLRPHNDGLWVLAEMGIIGFGLYATIFIMSLYYAYKGRNMAMFFGILCYMGFAFFSFPKERAFIPIILLVMIARVIPKQKWICLSPKLVYSINLTVVMLLVATIGLFTVRYKNEVLVRKVIAARGQKDWQQVINIVDERYSRLATIDPILATPVIFYRAEGYLRLRNFTPAFWDFKRAYKLNPYHIYTIENLGSCYALHGFKKEAIEHYEMALEITPSFKAARQSLNYLRGKL